MGLLILYPSLRVLLDKVLSILVTAKSIIVLMVVLLAARSLDVAVVWLAPKEVTEKSSYSSDSSGRRTAGHDETKLK